MKSFTVFIDFDNTITTYDVLDDIMARYSIDDRWAALEEKWKRGDIGSRDCLEGQIRGISITKEELDKYLSGVSIDPYFKKLIEHFKTNGIEHMILSDNFDYMLVHILENAGIGGLKIFSNSVKIDGNRLIPEFGLSNPDCGRCAHCKKTSLVKNLKEGSRSVYIGDGLSDLEAAMHADIVFAKDRLRQCFKEKGLDHVPFHGMKDVYDHFKEKLI